MVPNRIEAFCDLSGFAYLREYQGHLPCGSSQSSSSTVATGGSLEPIVVAEEIDGDGTVVRTWFVLADSHRDGFGLDPQRESPQTIVPHSIVSRDIRPGKPSAPYDPNAPVKLGCEIRFDELRLIKAQRDELYADSKRHLIHAQTYLDALNKAEDWRGNVEHLNAVVAAKEFEIAKRDDEIFELRCENELNRLSIANLQASYLALSNRQSFKTQFKEWCRSWVRCALRQVGLSN